MKWKTYSVAPVIEIFRFAESLTNVGMSCIVIFGVAWIQIHVSHHVLLYRLRSNADHLKEQSIEGLAKAGAYFSCIANEMVSSWHLIPSTSHLADVVLEMIEGMVESYPNLQYLDGFPEVRITTIALHCFLPLLRRSHTKPTCTYTHTSIRIDILPRSLTLARTKPSSKCCCCIFPHAPSPFPSLPLPLSLSLVQSGEGRPPCGRATWHLLQSRPHIRGR